MSIGIDDVIFHPAVSSDYCFITAATVGEMKQFIVVFVHEGNVFPVSLNEEEDMFLEVIPTGSKVSVADVFGTITELRNLKEIYLPVRIRSELYGEMQEFFSQVFSKVITAQYDDFLQSTYKH